MNARRLCTNRIPDNGDSYECGRPVVRGTACAQCLPGEIAAARAALDEAEQRAAEARARIALLDGGDLGSEEDPKGPRLETRAVIRHPHSILDARHTIERDGQDVVVSESWYEADGSERDRQEVRLPLSLLVHIALNTTAAERDEIDLRADWRGVGEQTPEAPPPEPDLEPAAGDEPA